MTDVSKILAELKVEREQIEEAIRRHERLGGQRPPGWAASTTPKRGGRKRGSNDPGSQPPPAAPAAARIASRLDRAVSEKEKDRPRPLCAMPNRHG